MSVSIALISAVSACSRRIAARASFARTGSWPRPFNARLRARRSAAWLINAPVTCAVAGGQAQQQRVEPVPHAGLFVDELIAGIDKQLQVGVEVSGVHPGQVRFAQRDPGDGDRVAFVVLAAVDGSGAAPRRSGSWRTSTTVSPAASSR